MPDPVSATLGSAAVSGGVSLFNSSKERDAASDMQQSQERGSADTMAAQNKFARKSADVQNYYDRRAMQQQVKYGRKAGNAQRYAYNDALQEQQDAFNDAKQEQRLRFNQFGNDLDPYIRAGRQGLRGQSDLLGFGGAGAEQAAVDRIAGGGQYQEQLRQGNENILRNASATGGLRGGNVQAATAQFAPSLLNRLVDQQYQRLSGQTTMGQNASNTLGQAGMNSANALGNYRMGSANQMSNLFGQQGQSQANMFTNVGNTIGTYNQGVGQQKGEMYDQFGNIIANNSYNQTQAQTSGIAGRQAASAQGLSGVSSALSQGFGAAGSYYGGQTSPVTIPTLKPV